jgi:hypothetical protein
MGVGFVIFAHLIAILILSVLVSLFSGVAAIFLVKKKEKRKHKIFLAFAAPFFGFFTFYFTVLFGSILISELKQVDIGIGDYFYVPLSKECKLGFVDTFEHGFIECNEKDVIQNISEIQQGDSRILGRTYDNKYFAFEIDRNELLEFTSEHELQTEHDKVDLIDVNKFYSEKRDSIVGYSMILVVVIAFISSIGIILMLKKAILGYLNFRY